MTLIKKCYLDNRDKVIQLLSSQSNSIDAIDDLFFALSQISYSHEGENKITTHHFKSGQFINLCNFYKDICAKTTELAGNRLKAAATINQGKAANSKITYGFDEEYMITAIFAGIKKYACDAFEVAEKWDLVSVNLGVVGVAVTKRDICVILAASVFGLISSVNLLNFITNNDIIPFTCLLEYFNRRLTADYKESDAMLVIKSIKNDVTEKMLNKMCNLIGAANDKALPRVMLFVADTSLYSSICYNQIHHVGKIENTKAISYECDKNLEMPEIIARDIFGPIKQLESGAKHINYVFGAEYYSCIKPSQDVSIKHQMYGVGGIHDKFPRTTDGTVARCVIFDEINTGFFRSTQKQTNISRILNYFNIFTQRIHFYRMCCRELFIDTPQNTICVSVNPQAIKHIQILEFFAVVIAAGIEGRDIEFHTGLVDSAEEKSGGNSNSISGNPNDTNDNDNQGKNFAEQFLAFMQKCRKNRVSVAELYEAILEFIKKIRRDVNNGYGEFDLMKVSFFDVI